MTTYYSKDHEWISVEGGTATIGITAYAQDALGDIVYVSLPEVGATVNAGDACGELESTKSVSDVYAPVTGEIVAVNDLTDNATLAHLLKFDSILGRLDAAVAGEDGVLAVDEDRVGEAEAADAVRDLAQLLL